MSTPSPYGARRKKDRTPPAGWRLLAVGETVQPGDQVYWCSRWQTVQPHEVGRLVSPYSFKRARQIAPERRTS